MKCLIVITRLKCSSDVSLRSVPFFTDHPASPATLNSHFDPSEQSETVQFSLLLQKPFNMKLPLENIH